MSSSQLNPPSSQLNAPSANAQTGDPFRFTSAKEIAAKATTIKAYVREATAAEKAGMKVETKPPKFPVPEELKAKFRNRLGALSPSSSRFRVRPAALRFNEAETRASDALSCSALANAGGGSLNPVAERPISRSPLRRHPRKNRHEVIDIVDDE
ncbi:MAG: hypothetical protein ACRD4O_11130, partial [Bryobacteraceae bacterium]